MCPEVRRQVSSTILTYLGMWGIVAWGVVPVGAFLVACYMSSTTLLMGLAEMVLSTPVRLHNFTLSLPMFMIAICGVLVVVSHSAVQRYESIGENASPVEGLLAPSMQDKGLSTRRANYREAFCNAGRRRGERRNGLLLRGRWLFPLSLQFVDSYHGFFK